MTKIITDEVQNIKGQDNDPSAYHLIETQTASGDATIEVDLIAGYSMIEFYWFGIQPSTTGSTLNLRVSNSGGSSWSSGTSDYGWSFYEILNDGAHNANGIGDSAHSSIQIGPEMTTGTDELADIEIKYYHPYNKWTQCYANFNYSMVFANSTAQGYIPGGGRRFNNQPHNAVQFFYSSGNIASGTLHVYGLRETIELNEFWRQQDWDGN